MKETLAIIGALVAIAGNLPYLWDILKGRVQPHPYTWLVGAIVSGTVFFGILVKGAGIGALPIAVSEFFTIIIFLFSLKYGFKAITTTDKIFLAVALFALIPWFFTKDPTLSIVIAVGIDLASLVPTFRKTWKLPSTETPLLYGSNALRHTLVLFSLQTYNIATTLHSIAMVIVNVAMTTIILWHKKGSTLTK